MTISAAMPTSNSTYSATAVSIETTDTQSGLTIEAHVLGTTSPIEYLKWYLAAELGASCELDDRLDTFDNLSFDHGLKSDPRTEHEDVTAQALISESAFDVEDEVSAQRSAEYVL